MTRSHRKTQAKRWHGPVGLAMAILVGVAMCPWAMGATYYVATNGSDYANGQTPGTAWATIDRGQPTKLSMAYTAAVMTVTANSTASFVSNGTIKVESDTAAYTSKNATVFFLSAAMGNNHAANTWVYDNAISGGNSFDPGDVILVGSGVYTQQVDLYTPGTAGNPITYRADGTVTVVGATYCFSLPDSNNGDYNVVDGFRLTGASSYGIYLYYGDYCAIKNCSIYKNGSDGIWTRGADSTVVSNCNLCFNSGAGFNSAVYGSTTIKNCNIVGNFGNGTLEYAGAVYVSYSCFYANGSPNMWQNYDGGYNYWDTESQLNARGVGWSNNIVKNPGFSDLKNNWNFNQFYANSPCLGAGAGGADIGAYQGSPTVPTSFNTYYVNASGGDDSRSAAEAQSTNTPWLTISRAAQTAIAGDTVAVAAGNYAEEVTITNSGSYNTPVTYRASGTVTVDGGAYGFHLSRVFDAVLDGFNVFSSSTAGVYLEDSGSNVVRHINSYANPGYGIYTTTAGRNTFEDINVYSNSSYGIYVYSGENLIRRARVWKNSTYGIYLRGNWNSVQSSDIFLNTSGSAFGVNAYGVYEFILNCNMISNSQAGIYVYPGRAYIVNCIFVGNGNCGVYSYVSFVTASNNCFFANTPHNVVYRNDGTNPYYDTPSQINGMTGTRMTFTNTIVADPWFKGAATNDFRLSEGSPCIDAGVPTDASPDLYGHRRPLLRAFDIGSYEFLLGGTIFYGR